MYIIELIVQAFRGNQYKKRAYNPLNSCSDETLEQQEDFENCEHLFMPLDSSNTLFACKHCGKIVPREKLKNKNIFENKPLK